MTSVTVVSNTQIQLICVFAATSDWNSSNNNVSFCFVLIYCVVYKRLGQKEKRKTVFEAGRVIVNDALNLNIELNF